MATFIGRLKLAKLWNPLTSIYDSQQILDSGIFGVIRHPIYFGKFMFFIGIMLMINLLTIFMAPFYWNYLRNCIIEEEKFLKKINPKYKKYMKKVSRIIF